MATQAVDPLQIIHQFGPHRAYSQGVRLASNVEPDRVVHTHCCFCGQQCGIQLKVKDNQVVIIDAGSHLDESILQVLEAADAVIVTVRPEIAALRAVLALGTYLHESGAMPKNTIYVANHLFSKEMVKLRDIEGVLGARVAVEIPNDPVAFLRAVNEGVPVVRAAPKSVAAQRLARLAAMALGDTRPIERTVPAKARRRLLPGLRASR